MPSLRPLLPVLILAILFGAPLAAEPEQELVVVASVSLDVGDSLDVRTLRRLYLGRQTRLGGHRIACLALPPGSPARARFNRTVLGLDEDELADYWIDEALQGGALPPAEHETPARLVAHVQRHPGAIGYILHTPGTPLPDGVQVLRIRR